MLPAMVSLTYKKAGVDKEAGYQVVRQAKSLAKSTYTPGVIGQIGAFGGFFRPPWKNYTDPILVAASDGVGTKIKIALAVGQCKTVGIDLVAMNVNDLLCCGARPLFFLDYVAAHKISPRRVAALLEGVAAGCRQAGCALIGGETAEMTDVYCPGEYDLAGFAVGIVERKGIITGQQIKPGMKLVGLASSGLHSNGYTLVRRIIQRARISYQRKVKELPGPLWKTLLAPTKIYVRSVLRLLDRCGIYGLAHITGGGLLENVERILPAGCRAVFQRDSWPRLPVFDWLQRLGGIKSEEMWGTFNMGLGLVLVVKAADEKKILAALRRAGEKVYLVGEIKAGPRKVEIF